jgi:pimeloyl-ACP methyl ester carboxylesterase
MREAGVNYHREGSGPPLLLVHGIGSRWQVWRPVIGELARERDVIAIDLPGFGASPMPAPGTEPGPTTLTRMVAEFARSLELERPHVAGNSLGGWIALELAREGLVASATALSPAGFYTQAEAVFLLVSLKLSRRTARALQSRAAGVTRTALRRRLAFSQLVAHPERIPAADAAEHLRALGDCPWFEPTLDAIVRERFFAGRSLGVPVTVGWGQHDRLLLPRQAVRAAREVPDAKLVTLTGCGHVPTYDDPAQVARVILEGSAPS